MAAVLLLGSPRSCSTVTCAMLGQHPALYGFPELNLFAADTVEELLDRATWPQTGANSYVAGLLRTIAQLHFGFQTHEFIDVARKWLSERADWSTRQMFDYLLSRVHPRIGVEKSPRTSLTRQTLDRALSCRDDVRVLHLTRHPVATIRSLHVNHIRASGGVRSPAHSFGLIGFYARMWVDCQETILDGVAHLSPSRIRHVRAEELLSAPAAHLADLCRWLEIDSGPTSIESMQHPERSPYACVGLPGLGDDGDSSFQGSPRLRAYPPTCNISVPSEWQLGSELSSRMNAVSHCLGYDLTGY